MRRLTEDLPGTGGTVKAEPADFQVTELPLYEPSGEGDHTWLYVEKQGIGTLEAAERIAGALGLPRRVVGTAGLKDARAVTRQWMSIERVDPARAERIDLPGIRILQVTRHRNKLKIGHLAGNRFDVRIRGPRPGSAADARAIVAALAERGVPNGFDVQRFGRRGDNHLLGRDLVLGRYKAFCDRFLGGPSDADSARQKKARAAYDRGDLRAALAGFQGSYDQVRVLRTLLGGGSVERAARSLPKQLTRLLVSALQSDLFNAVLERRMDSLDRLFEGDLAYIHGRGAVFRVEDPAAEQPRADRLEISPSGPLVGHKITMASGRPGEIEREVLEEKSVRPADFERVKALRLRGDRRPLRVPLLDPEVHEEEGGDLRLVFTLPPGAYATIVLGEVTKGEVVGL